jgi:hypothetical protein
MHIADPEAAFDALSDVAEMAAQAGETTVAAQVAEAAHALLSTVLDPRTRALGLAATGNALGYAGETTRALATLVPACVPLGPASATSCFRRSLRLRRYWGGRSKPSGCGR